MDKNILQILFTPTISISRMCLSELIWMPPSERLFIQKALVKCLSRVQSVGRLAETRTRPPPVAALRWPVNVQANCDQGVLAR